MAQKKRLKEQQREERERMILDYAEKVLLEKGYYDVSMDEIAAGVGIAKGTLYLHFPKKEDLVYSLVKPKMHAFLASVEQAQSIAGNPKDKLIYILQQELSGTFFQFLLKSGSDMAAIFKSHEREISAILPKIFGRIHQILNEGKEEGVFDPLMPIEFMSSAFINLFEPHLYQEMVSVRKMPVEAYIQHASDLFFRGIKKTD